MTDLGSVRVVDVYGETIAGAVMRYTDVERQVAVSAPGYLHDRFLLDFNPLSVDVLVLSVHPDHAEPAPLWSTPGPVVDRPLAAWADLNFRAAMKASGLDGKVGEWVEGQQDRGYYEASNHLLKHMVESKFFSKAPGGFHEVHGYRRVGSWKTVRKAPKLQVTIHKSNLQAPATMLAEVDLDMKSGVGHIWEVLRNHLGDNLTHPHVVNQLLAAEWKDAVELSYHVKGMA